MLSPLAFSPLSCYLHPAFLTYPDHLRLHFCSHANGRVGRMPYGGCPTRTARSLCSYPPPSLPCQSSTTDSQSYSLQIPLDKASAPTTLLAAHMVSLVSSDKPKTSATAAKDSPTHHICSSAFSLATCGKVSQLHAHSDSYWPLSLSHTSTSLPHSPSP